MSEVAAIRAFNRFYTQKIGVLDEGLLRSPYSLAEVRVLWELANRELPSAAELARDLGLDAGYLSRMLARLERKHLVTRRPSPSDRRRSHLALSPRGRRVFAGLDARSARDVARLVDTVAPDERPRLVGAMHTIERLLGGRAAPAREAYLLREPRPGELGLIVQRHGAIYAAEYGWDDRFEALVAEIVARFVQRRQPARERCFIAEREGELAGCVLLVARSRAVAQLRLLLVEPRARGLGIGARLVDECIRFATQAGYRKLMLWTNSVLTAARHVYERAGFVLVAEEKHESFGRELVGQTWELALGGEERRH